MEEFKIYLKDITSKADDMIQKVDTKLDKLSQSGNMIKEVSSSLLHSAEVMLESADRDRGDTWFEVVKKKTKKNMFIVTG